MEKNRNENKNIWKKTRLNEQDQERVNGGRWYEEMYDKIRSLVSDNQDRTGEMASSFPRWPVG